MVIKQSADGYGTVSCISATFDVDVYGEDVKITEPAPRNALVELKCSNASFKPPPFYISARERDGDRITLHCSDRMMNTQQVCSLTEKEFTEKAVGDDKVYTIDFNTAIAHIATQCGFDGWLMPVSDFTPLTYLRKEDVYSRPCRQVLDTVANILKGCWVCSGNYLNFIPFMPADVEIPYYIPDHSEIINRGTRTFSRIEISDGFNLYSNGGTVSDTEYMITGETPYGSQELVDYISSNITGKAYSAFVCEKGIAGSYIPALSYVDFGDGIRRYVNDVTLYPTAQGVYISCGCNSVAEEEFDYMNSLEREIEMILSKGTDVTESKKLTFYRNLNK